MEISKYILEQNEKRGLFVEHDSPEKVAQFLQDESKELIDAIQESMVTGDPFPVASEIGDVMYLLIKLSDMIGIDPFKAAEMKVFRNSYKYQDHLMSNGRDYKEAHSLAKEAWKAMGGDYTFSHVYLDYLAHDI